MEKIRDEKTKRYINPRVRTDIVLSTEQITITVTLLQYTIKSPLSLLSGDKSVNGHCCQFLSNIVGGLQDN